MEDVSIAALLLRLVVSMGVVVSLMLLAAKLVRRSAAGGGRGGRKVTRTPIAVSALQPLTKTAHVAVVRAAGRELVLGVTDHQVTLLHSGIEPRDDVMDLDVADSQTTTGSIEPIADPTADRARIAPSAAPDASPREDRSLPAWTDALETLRELTVRR